VFYTVIAVVGVVGNILTIWRQGISSHGSFKCQACNQEEEEEEKCSHDAAHHFSELLV